ncbi:SCP2 sterol-binding domain-containing protein [Paenibacillus pini]|uniref:SCP2 domain-containing protein n=1 Tax=Paenibacillus pini JCM 16418 TaxID=1236976 RepID=W7YG30_9BACL|nr:SCP2 sterol-binding domain-containing protein [Paenibacillus pini]GAF07427.1 hypothetical protein JCM16418_1443 [Paenibacillus pini JCM 16418]
MAIKDELQQLANIMESSPEPISTLNAVYQFNVKDDCAYQVSFQEGVVEVAEGVVVPPDCTLILNENNLRKLLNDELNATMAFMTGSLKVEGKMGLALKLQEILKKYTR